MNKKVTRTLTVLGLEIARVEVETEQSVPGPGRERAGGRPRGGGQIALNESDVTLILAEAVRGTGSLISDRIAFKDGSELIVDGNGDPYTACQNLRKLLKTELNVMTAVIGVARVAGMYSSEEVGPAGLFNRSLAEVIHGNWEQLKINEK